MAPEKLDVLIIALGLYLVAAVPGLLIGLGQTGGPHCSGKPARGTYIYPFHKLGCWLGESP